MNWFILLIGLQLADVLSTMAFLRNGTGYEVNPIARFAMRKLGRLTGLLVMKAIVGIGVWVLWWSQAHFIVIFACLFYSVIIVNNIRIAMGK